MDLVLYKYREDSAYTETLITSGQVFLATAHQLNDPFECTLQEISQGWLDEQTKTAMQGALGGFIDSYERIQGRSEHFYGLNHTKAKRAIERIVNAGGLEESYEAMRAFIRKRIGRPPSDCRTTLRKIDEQLTETGIFSLSASPVQTLMWAHYAGEHRGINLGFRAVAGSKLANPDHCLPVTYSDEIPTMEGNGLEVVVNIVIGPSGLPTSTQRVAFTDKTFQRIVTTKSAEWAYEQEYRYIEPFGGLCDWPGEVAECTFGLRCPEDRRRHYIGLLEVHVPNEVMLFETRAKPGSTKLERVPLACPMTRPRTTARPSLNTDSGVRQMPTDEFMAKMQQLLQQKQYAEVIFQVDENLKDHPDNPVLLHAKATAHGLAQDRQAAYLLYRKISKLCPDVAAGWYGMGCALTAMGKLDRVVDLFERAYKLEPNDPSIALNLGVNLMGIPARREEGLACLRHARMLGHRRAQRLIDEAERQM